MGSSLASVIIVCVGMHLKAGSERECVHTLVGVNSESKFLSLLCGCSLVYKVWIVSMKNAFKLSFVSKLRMSVYKGVM